ncbi:MAG: hypothetical protein V4692_15575, partial [Bdellovibrionota bacterium]
MEPLEIARVTKYLTDKGVLVNDYGVSPTKKFKVKTLSRALEYLEVNPFQYDASEVEPMIPALFNSYINAGAVICGEPAIDREFRCIDFLTVMKVDDMNASFKGKFKV